ncbi:MAG: hypothetical protein JWO68_3877, partial [Actinomycetia bacterium]|nr:hypothetical protein [Actinomycetes bacterium]
TGIGGLVDVAGTAMWSLYNAHGDILGTTNAAGTFTAAPVADELGVGTTSTSRLGWLGQQQRPSVGGALGVMRMGVRLYDPRLGRFLEVDPVAGGSANDYDYCAGDPVNCFDLAGTMKTPENKAASNDLGTFLRWYSGLTKQQQQGMQQLLAGAMRMVQSPAPPAPTSRRGPDPSAPGGDGGPRGLPSANGGPRGQQPPPSSPRDYHPPSVGCIASGVGVATGVLGLAIATDGASLLLSGVGGGASGVGIVTSC